MQNFIYTRRIVVTLLIGLLSSLVLSACQPIQPPAVASASQSASPTAYMLIQHSVADFAKWKAVFDSKADLRKGAGEQSALILHDAADPNALTLLFGWDSIEHAQAYASNPALKEAMQNAGVNGPPTFAFLTAEEAAAIGATTGQSFMLIQHSVADFAKWKAVFDSKADLRKGAGEQSALILHDAADPNALTLLFAWDAIENAQAYASNPALKEAMQNAGVNSPPTFAFLAAD